MRLRKLNSLLTQNIKRSLSFILCLLLAFSLMMSFSSVSYAAPGEACTVWKDSEFRCGTVAIANDTVGSEFLGELRINAPTDVTYEVDMWRSKCHWPGYVIKSWGPRFGPNKLKVFFDNYEYRKGTEVCLESFIFKCAKNGQAANCNQLMTVENGINGSA